VTQADRQEKTKKHNEIKQKMVIILKLDLPKGRSESMNKLYNLFEPEKDLPFDELIIQVYELGLKQGKEELKKQIARI